MHVITSTNIRDAYMKALLYVVENGEQEDSRLGPVLVAPSPVTIHYQFPKEHVLLDPIRDANPFFHLMESVWMLAGRQDAAFLNNYIRDFGERFAKDGIVMDAYGHRWLYGQRYNQLKSIIDMLRKDPTSRQAVLQMWGAGRDDLNATTAKPCNLVITFRINNNKLNMHVFNRSNDLVWGCCGANAVHFPILQEYLAGMIGVNLGEYWQITTNLHIYKEMYEKLLERSKEYSSVSMGTGIYERTVPLVTYPQVFDVELLETLKIIDDINHDEVVYTGNISNVFLREVVVLMAEAHRFYRRKNMKEAFAVMKMVKADDWRAAGTQWLERRNAK